MSGMFHWDTLKDCRSGSASPLRIISTSLSQFETKKLTVRPILPCLMEIWPPIKCFLVSASLLIDIFIISIFQIFTYYKHWILLEFVRKPFINKNWGHFECKSQMCYANHWHLKKSMFSASDTVWRFNRFGEIWNHCRNCDFQCFFFCQRIYSEEYGIVKVVSRAVASGVMTDSADD